MSIGEVAILALLVWISVQLGRLIDVAVRWRDEFKEFHIHYRFHNPVPDDVEDIVERREMEQAELWS